MPEVSLSDEVLHPIPAQGEPLNVASGLGRAWVHQRGLRIGVFISLRSGTIPNRRGEVLQFSVAGGAPYLVKWGQDASLELFLPANSSSERAFRPGCLPAAAASPPASLLSVPSRRLRDSDLTTVRQVGEANQNLQIAGPNGLVLLQRTCTAAEAVSLDRERI